MQLVRANPRRERVLLFRRGTGPRTIAGDGAIGLEVILPGFRLTAGQLLDALYFR